MPVLITHYSGCILESTGGQPVNLDEINNNHFSLFSSRDCWPASTSIHYILGKSSARFFHGRAATHSRDIKSSSLPKANEERWRIKWRTRRNSIPGSPHLHLHGEQCDGRPAMVIELVARRWRKNTLEVVVVLFLGRRPTGQGERALFIIQRSRSLPRSCTRRTYVHERWEGALCVNACGWREVRSQ